MRQLAHTASLWLIATLVALGGAAALGEDRASLRITLTVPERPPPLAATTDATRAAPASLCLATRTPGAWAVHVWVDDRPGPRLTGGRPHVRADGKRDNAGRYCTDASLMHSAMADTRRKPGAPLLLVVSPE